MILDSGLNTDASFVVPPKGSDPANGSPGTTPVTITPTKANGCDDPMESLVGDPVFKYDDDDGGDAGAGVMETEGLQVARGGTLSNDNDKDPNKSSPVH